MFNLEITFHINIRLFCPEFVCLEIIFIFQLFSQRWQSFEIFQIISWKWSVNELAFSILYLNYLWEITEIFAVILVLFFSSLYLDHFDIYTIIHYAFDQ